MGAIVWITQLIVKYKLMEATGRVPEASKNMLKRLFLRFRGDDGKRRSVGFEDM